MPYPAENSSAEPVGDSGTGSAAEKKTPELVGEPVIESVAATTGAGQDEAFKLETQIPVAQPGCDGATLSAGADQSAPGPQEQATPPTEVFPGIHAPELTTALDPNEASKLNSSTPVADAAPMAFPSSTTTADGAARGDAAATGVDASPQLPLPS